MKNTKLMAQLANHLQEIPEPRVRTGPKGVVGWRSNDPTGPYVKRHDPITEETLRTILATPCGALNLTIGRRSGSGQEIGGLAMIALGIDAEKSVTAYRETESAERPRTLTTVAAQLLGLEGDEMHELLLGPNFAGGLAAWITPNETARAVLAMTTTNIKAGECWSHINRAMLAHIEHGMPIAPRHAAMDKWAETLGAEQEATTPQALEARKEMLRKTYPDTDVAPSAMIAPTARIAEGVQIKSDAEMGEGTRLESGVTVEAGTKIGAGAQIGIGAQIAAQASVGQRTTVGNHAVIGTGTAVGEDAELGTQVWLAADVNIGEGAKIGNKTRVGQSSRIGKGAQIGEYVRLETKVTIGPNCNVGTGTYMGQESEVSEADIDKYRWVPSKTKITTHAKAERYAIRATRIEGNE